MKDIRASLQERYSRIDSLSRGAAGVADAANEATGSLGNGERFYKLADTGQAYAEMELSALPREAIEASLGCANPLVFAQLKPGETVLDLGSGGGMDALLASRMIGDQGKIYGLDMTDAMLQLANGNKAKMEATNVEFIKGYLERIPLDDEIIDVIISNCVINLIEEKEKALSEAYRVLKKGGRLRIVDVVNIKAIPSELRKKIEIQYGCLTGTLSKEAYTAVLQQCGFMNVQIETLHVFKRKPIRSTFFTEITTGDAQTDANRLDGAFASALICADK